MSFVKLIRGLFILWIAVKLFVDSAPEEEVQRSAHSILQALWVIVVADITMSVDNVLAVAGASKGNLFLLLFGLGLSIPFVVFTSSLLSMLMDKYPFIIYVGAGILGKVGAEMIFRTPSSSRGSESPKRSFMGWKRSLPSASSSSENLVALEI